MSRTFSRSGDVIRYTDSERGSVLKIHQEALRTLRPLSREQRRGILDKARADALPYVADKPPRSGSGNYTLGSQALPGMEEDLHVFSRRMEHNDRTIQPVEASLNFDLWMLLIPLARKEGLTVLQPYGHSADTVYVPEVPMIYPLFNRQQSNLFAEQLETIKERLSQDFFAAAEKHLSAAQLPHGSSKFHLKLDILPRNVTLRKQVRKRFWESDKNYVRRVISHSVVFDPIFAAYK